MENPYATQKDYAVYSDQRRYGYTWGGNDKWLDMDELDLFVEGPHLIIGSITFSTANSGNVGFRLTNTCPLRQKDNNRIPVHFSVEPYNLNIVENLCTFSFHMAVYCRGEVKLQVLLGDARGKIKSFIRVNMMMDDEPKYNQAYNHKPICTLSAIPLLGIEEQKNNNAVAAKPIGRAAFMPEEVDDLIKARPMNPDKNPISGGTSKL